MRLWRMLILGLLKITRYHFNHREFYSIVFDSKGVHIVSSMSFSECWCKVAWNTMLSYCTEHLIWNLLQLLRYAMSFSVNKWSIAHESHEEKWKQIPLLVNSKYSAPNSGSHLQICLESCMSQYAGVSNIWHFIIIALWAIQLGRRIIWNTK